jgi:hypothetical protein
MTFSETFISAQYAFAIGFDFGTDGVGEQLDTRTTTLEAVRAAIQGAGLPEIDSDRWDEFGQGRIFWGTKAECDAVQKVLSQFPLFLQEERNLEAGYYGTLDHNYYVDEAGNLYSVISPTGITGDSTLEPISAIPLDAYRLKTIAPHLQAAVERSLSTPPDPNAPSTPLFSEPPPSLPKTESIAPFTQDVDAEVSVLQAQVTSLTAEIEALQTVAAAKATSGSGTQILEGQIAQQASHIHELERQVTTFEDQIASLQGIIAAKIDPQLHASLETQLIQQAQQIQQLKEQLTQAQVQVNEWQRKAEMLIDPQAYAQLQQQLSTQVAQGEELQQRVQRLELQLQDAVAIAAQKIEPAKYQALEQSVADKTVQVEDFRRTIQQLQRDLKEWQTVAESKVEWSEYETIRQELRLLTKRKKGLFSRLFGWLFG